jgi:hypothetical protein
MTSAINPPKTRPIDFRSDLFFLGDILCLLPEMNFDLPIKSRIASHFKDLLHPLSIPFSVVIVLRNDNEMLTGDGLRLTGIRRE